MEVVYSDPKNSIEQNFLIKNLVLPYRSRTAVQFLEEVNWK